MREEVVEGTLDVGLVVVVGVDVEELLSAGCAVELVEQIALLAGTGGVSAGYEEAWEGLLDLWIEDREEVVGLVAV